MTQSRAGNFQTGTLGQLGGILDGSDAQAGAARAVVRTAAADGASVSSRLIDTLGINYQPPVGSWPSPCPSEEVRSPTSGLGSSDADLEVDSLIQQLARGEGDLFNYVDKSKNLPGNKCVVCLNDYQQTTLIDGRHEIKVLPCFHSICAGCLQALVAQSDESSFPCPACNRRTQKMQNLHEYLAHFEVLSNMDLQSMAQSDFNCEECVSGSFAQTYCEDCVMHLCEPCSRHHRRAKNTCRHTLVELKDRMHNNALHHRAQFCAMHRTSRYELYCHDCELLICAQCAREDHRDHSYKLPSAALIEDHRQRVQSIIDNLCNKLLEDQAMQKVLHQRHGQELSACEQARANIATAFGELTKAAEDRCRALIADSEENSHEPRKRLEEEKRRCSTALVDIWRAIEFTEKVVDRGTDVEVLMARGHMFREGLHTQQLQDWNRMSMAPAPPGLTPNFGAGWSSSRESDTILGSLAAFGSVQFDTQYPVTKPAVTGRTKSLKWADVFEDPTNEGPGCAPSSFSMQQDITQALQQDELPDLPTAVSRPLQRQQRPLGSSQSLAPMSDPLWVPVGEQQLPRAVSLDSMVTTQRRENLRKGDAAKIGDEGDGKVEALPDASPDVPDTPDVRGDPDTPMDAGTTNTMVRRRRRRPRGRGGKDKSSCTAEQSDKVTE